ADEQEDEELARELIENEKERAEHVMLVDLERNDLGRVCKYGTVEVDEFMVIEKYSHVMHIVSNVRGEVEEDKDAFDLVKAVFPGGTITGAPKIRTMEIIEELEPVRRGIYTGSIGWIGYSGDTELNIVIRTLLAKDGKAHVQAGAGIVIDSNPENEYKESLKKAIALWRAKERSEEMVR
ncbi:aminodeoxychorismate synthase component I, partial [Bacillus cereus]